MAVIFYSELPPLSLYDFKMRVMCLHVQQGKRLDFTPPQLVRGLTCTRKIAVSLPIDGRYRAELGLKRETRIR